MPARRRSRPMDLAVAETGMEYGGITPIGLPPAWPLLVDGAVVATPEVIVGSGLRRSKLALPGCLADRAPGRRGRRRPGPVTGPHPERAALGVAMTALSAASSVVEPQAEPAEPETRDRLPVERRGRGRSPGARRGGGRWPSGRSSGAGSGPGRRPGPGRRTPGSAPRRPPAPAASGATASMRMPAPSGSLNSAARRVGPGHVGDPPSTVPAVVDRHQHLGVGRRGRPRRAARRRSRPLRRPRGRWRRRRRPSARRAHRGPRARGGRTAGRASPDGHPAERLSPPAVSYRRRRWTSPCPPSCRPCATRR